MRNNATHIPFELLQIRCAGAQVFNQHHATDRIFVFIVLNLIIQILYPPIGHTALAGIKAILDFAGREADKFIMPQGINHDFDLLPQVIQKPNNACEYEIIPPIPNIVIHPIYCPQAA